MDRKNVLFFRFSNDWFFSYTCTTAVLDVVDVVAPGVRGPEAESVAWFISDSWGSKNGKNKNKFWLLLFTNLVFIFGPANYSI